MRFLKRFSCIFTMLCLFQGGFATAAHAAITLGVSDWPGWVAWYVAEKEGYFHKYHVDVKLVWFPSYVDSINALSAGQLDANSQALIDSLAPIEKGLPLKVILVTDNSAGNDALMVANGIHTFGDLTGKTIAVEKSSIEEYLATTAMRRRGFDPKKAKWVYMGTGDAAAALMAGRVDGAGVWNPWINRVALAHQGHALVTSADFPGLIPDLVVAQESALKKHRQEFVGLVKAWYDVVRFIHRNPLRAAEIMAPHVGLHAKEYELSLKGTRLFDVRLNRQAMQKDSSPVSLYRSTVDTGAFLKAVGAITKVPDPSAFIDSYYVRAAARH